MKKTFKIIGYILLAFVLFGSLLAFLLARWYTNRYGDTGFMSIISTFMTPWKGCSNNIAISWKLNALLPAGILTVVLYPIFFYRGKKLRLSIPIPKKETKMQIFPIKPLVSKIVFSVLCTALIVAAAFMVRFPQFIRDYYFSDTMLYADNYAAPDEVEITFPERKRNLIYIYLESMETSFMSKELGGSNEVNLIPELYELATENVNFSHNDGVGGWPRVTHTTWTSAALVAQTSGLPLTMDLSKIEIGKFEGYLPGAKTLQDILSEEGYRQMVMFGSDGTFGARKEYFELHSENLEVYDLYSAREEGRIPEDYMVWWGFQDQLLFEYAKHEIAELANGEEPFAFTMLTADTHHIDGYYTDDPTMCEDCSDQHKEQYENVLSCSSRKVAKFIEWIQQQPFYENTTVIVCGDHPSMDNQYFVRNVDEDYERHVYNCIINAPIDAKNTKNRVFTPMDMFPTTLAAIGCEIEGERLGLGTNLFSEKPTLAEEKGIDYLNEQIAKRSVYYIENFLEKPKKD